ncbi:UDP-N-acetylmuramate--L-alanine ligase [Marixanthomonas sp. SCSIO 43207]|uniref:UDP-N-acetylmuramate--L-alanine ligase n=1 Tax=Marixanthomonas sp. SCSIO 43207 TaxID=2779360 RepID=UPI001CA9A14C|nr:UDP-N-acetylmuramate--L-alanine ligase [Marixanthomonas sp. SCSIO 43207]UAB81475.1 UDP-N-acetylmuramate--L-alanine ligase [Marixanthomonas sp. SCSIO 43207]
MKYLDNIQTLYFIGIGGIGMSALARYCKLKGYDVSGYDRTESDITDTLISEDISISFEVSVESFKENSSDKENTLIVYTPAVKANAILSYVKDQNYTIVKRAALLGEITKDTFCLAVAGTHGKTTTSAILGHLLAETGMAVTAFLGGIAENYKSNFISNGTMITVVEADEFDRSFMQLRPDIACITSMDADHLDIYGEASEFENTFKDFSQLIENKEHLLYKKGLTLEGRTVAIEEKADYEAQNVKIEDGAYVFDLKTPTRTIENLHFFLPGKHNLHNAVTALGMAILAGSPTYRLPEALQSFKGVHRRFSYRIKTQDLVLIDDYAHHPTELNALHQAVTEMYPQEEKLIVFQPHLFSRTKDFATEFAESLSQFDEIVLLDIYPAREEPLQGITSKWLLEKVKSSRKRLVTKDELPTVVKQSKCKIKIMAGAGDIGVEVNKVKEYLQDEA